MSDRPDPYRACRNIWCWCWVDPIYRHWWTGPLPTEHDPINPPANPARRAITAGATQ